MSRILSEWLGILGVFLGPKSFLAATIHRPESFIISPTQNSDEPLWMSSFEESGVKITLDIRFLPQAIRWRDEFVEGVLHGRAKKVRPPGDESHQKAAVPPRTPPECTASRFPARTFFRHVGDGTKPEFLPEQKWTGNYRVKAAKMGGQMSFGGCSTTQSLFLG
jgi:hypothetical protein